MQPSEAALEAMLFRAFARIEDDLLNLPAARRQEAIDGWLLLPSAAAQPSYDALKFLFECEYAISGADPLRTALAHSFRRIAEDSRKKFPSEAAIERTRRIREVLARRREKGHHSCLDTASPGAASVHFPSLKLEDLSDALCVVGESSGAQSMIDELQRLRVSQLSLPAVQAAPKRPPIHDRLETNNPPTLASLPQQHKKPRTREPEVIHIDDDDEDLDSEPPKPNNPFVTAKQQYISDEFKKNGTRPTNMPRARPAVSNQQPQQPVRKTLGGRRRFVPPMKQQPKDDEQPGGDNLVKEVNKRVFPGSNHTNKDANGEPVDERLKNIDPRMVEMIQNEIMDNLAKIEWDDIAGLAHAKKSIQEAVIWPMKRPDIISGLRRAPRGILLFGPPGTGKTLIGKCIATTADCTFFSISASSLTSKYVGEGEKMVRALFAVARVHQPSVIFIDEIDSLLTQRTDGEFEASRRIKTEFLIQFDGAHVNDNDGGDRILVIGATNRPQEIDEAARRRLIKRYYIPLPDVDARRCIVENLLKKQKHSLSDAEIIDIATKTKGYSGSDMDGLCREAALGPIREIPPDHISNISVESVRAMTMQDFEYALMQVRASVSERDLDMYKDWNQQFGSLPIAELS